MLFSPTSRGLRGLIRERFRFDFGGSLHIAGIYRRAIPGLFLGCFLANLLTGAIVLDIIFGSLATLIGALGGYALRKHPLFVPLPTVISNTIIVPLILAYGYRLEDFVPFMMLTVGAGEILSAYVLGIVLYYALKNYRNRLFG